MSNKQTNVDTERRAKVLVERIFERSATFIAYNPWKVVLVTVIVQLLLGLSLLTRSLNNDIEELYAPRNTVTDKNIGRLLQFYPDESGTNFSVMHYVKKPLYADVIISKPADANGTKALTDEDVKEVILNVSSVSFPTSYYQADLDKVCAKHGDKCVVSASENTGTELLENYFKIDNGHMIRYSAGSTSMDFRNNLTRPVKIRFYLRQDTKVYYDDSILWQHAFVRAMKKWDNENISVHFSHSNSFLQEVGNDTYPDIRIFSLAVGIFITYCGFLISGGDCVSKRMNIGRIGLGVVPLAVLGSWGLMSGIGMTFTNIVGVMPFFVMFHELNMALSLMSAVSNNMDEEEGAQRVIKAVKEVAVPSLIVFLAHIIPFAFTVMSKYVALETFGVYTVATFLFNFILHFSFFVGCMAIHEKRIDASRHSCCCHKVLSRDDPEVVDRSCCFRCCCSGRKPSSREQVETCLERLPRKLFSRIVLLGPVQFVLVLLTLVCVGASIWKTMELRIDTIQETDVTAKSYFQEYFQVDKVHFDRRDVFTFAVSTKKMTFTQNGNINKLLSIYEHAKRLPGMNGNKSFFWLDEFHKPSQKYSSEYEFLNLLQEFLAKDDKYNKDIIFNRNSNAVQEFRFYVFADSLQNSQEAIRLKEIVDDFVDDAFDDLDVKARLHVPSLYLIDNYKRPVYELGIFAAIQLGVLFLLSILFSNTRMVIFHVLFWYSSVTFGIFASLTLLGVTMNIVSVINLMIGLCYGTEVIMCTLVGYMYSEGTNNSSRVYNVIQRVTPILYNLTFGTLCGLAILLLEKSYVFQTVFKVISVCVAVAWVHSFAFIPPALAVVGVGRSIFFRSNVEKSFMLDLATTTSAKSNSRTEKPPPESAMVVSTITKVGTSFQKPSHETAMETSGQENKGYLVEEVDDSQLTKL